MPPGRPKNIKTPEQMWNNFQAYVRATKEKPIIVKDWVGKDAKQVDRPKERPLTMEGFENFLFDNGVITDVSDYFENKEKRYTDFVPICRAIRRKIRQDQIEGGMAGTYNPSITQRLNNLVERQQTEGTQELTITVKRGDRHGKGNNTEHPAPGPGEGQAGGEAV